MKEFTYDGQYVFTSKGLALRFLFQLHHHVDILRVNNCMHACKYDIDLNST